MSSFRKHNYNVTTNNTYLYVDGKLKIYRLFRRITINLYNIGNLISLHVPGNISHFGLLLLISVYNRAVL